MKSTMSYHYTHIEWLKLKSGVDFRYLEKIKLEPYFSAYIKKKQKKKTLKPDNIKHKDARATGTLTCLLVGVQNVQPCGERVAVSHKVKHTLTM